MYNKYLIGIFTYTYFAYPVVTGENESFCVHKYQNLVSEFHHRVRTLNVHTYVEVCRHNILNNSSSHAYQHN